MTNEEYRELVDSIQRTARLLDQLKGLSDRNVNAGDPLLGELAALECQVEVLVDQEQQRKVLNWNRTSERRQLVDRVPVTVGLVEQPTGHRPLLGGRWSNDNRKGAGSRGGPGSRSGGAADERNMALAGSGR